MNKAVRAAVDDDRREYLFDMLSQLAKMADECKEPGVALVLNTMVVSRGRGGRKRMNGKMPEPIQ